MTSITTLLSFLICLACICGTGVIIYDYLQGKISGPVASAFMCIVVSIMGLSGIQLIT